MGIICWIYRRIIKADFTPSFKVGNFNFFESAAASECIVADFGDGVPDAHRSQAAAENECIVADRGNGVGYLHRSQAAAVRECRIVDRGDGVGNLHRSQAAAAIEDTRFQLLYRFRNNQIFYLLSIKE